LKYYTKNQAATFLQFQLTKAYCSDKNLRFSEQAAFEFKTQVYLEDGSGLDDQ
jgi:hypothetical protein